MATASAASVPSPSSAMTSMDTDSTYSATRTSPTCTWGKLRTSSLAVNVSSSPSGLRTVTTRVSWSMAVTTAETVMDWLAENDGLSITASADADAAFSSAVAAKATAEKRAAMGRYLRYFIVEIL